MLHLPVLAKGTWHSLQYTISPRKSLEFCVELVRVEAVPRRHDLARRVARLDGEIDALITQAGGSAYGFGYPSGAILSLNQRRRVT